jgi:hypothetical protein
MGGQFHTANAFSCPAVMMEPRRPNWARHHPAQTGHERKGNRKMSVAIGHAECALEAHNGGTEPII